MNTTNSGVKVPNQNISTGKSVNTSVSVPKEVPNRPNFDPSKSQIFVTGESLQNTVRIQTEALKNMPKSRVDSLNASTLDVTMDE